LLLLYENNLSLGKKGAKKLTLSYNKKRKNFFSHSDASLIASLWLIFFDNVA
jgi:hypothetical protein